MVLLGVEREPRVKENSDFELEKNSYFYAVTSLAVNGKIDGGNRFTVDISAVANWEQVNFVEAVSIEALENSELNFNFDCNESADEADKQI